MAKAKIFNMDMDIATQSWTSWNKKHSFKFEEGSLKSIPHAKRVFYSADDGIVYEFFQCECNGEIFLRRQLKNLKRKEE